MQSGKGNGMQVTDAISITELSKLLKKSRPTVYKYISDFEMGNELAVPEAVCQLFHRIVDSDISKAEINRYCEKRFGAPELEVSEECQEIINLIKKYERDLDLRKIRKFIEKEIERL